MLEHLRLVEEPGSGLAMRTDLAAQDETLTYFRQVLENLEASFGQLHSGLATLHANVEELAREKDALPIRKADKPQARPALSRHALRLSERSAGRASGF